MSPGLSLAHYRITAKLGEGGMGEVWRATDTKLDREVAIKTLPEALAADPDRMARFEREAKVLASLNHPNIAAIYGVEERALVMELVPGPTLAERIAQGAMLVDETPGIARQIAEALEYAHEKGIIHRDLKPANIKITPEGRVKVLDFGLAKAMSSESGAAGRPEASPTLTMRATMAGVILGTAAYMSPEQARGQEADKRADIWSFGVLVYEMLTGRKLFDAPTVSDTLAAVLRADLDWSLLPAGLPSNIRTLLLRCLERDPKRRLRDIGDARLELDAEPSAAAAETAARPKRLSWLPWGIAAILLGMSIWLALSPIRTAPPQPRVQSIILPPERVLFSPMLGISGGIALSPDGLTLAFVGSQDGKSLLWVRPLDSLAARPLPGTENAYHPFWSPDSRTIAFFADPKLKRVDMAGGPAREICDATGGRGGTWNSEGTIVFALTRGLYRAPAAGGHAVQVITRESGGSPFWPWFLPDGRHFLYSERPSSVVSSVVSRILRNFKTTIGKHAGALTLSRF
jgi:serine/threonine-protein kinase